VAVNLYPFRETVARGDVPVSEAMEKVDIGGPTMIRAAAKNHADVWVVVDPADYGRVLDALDREGQRAGDLAGEKSASAANAGASEDVGAPEDAGTSDDAGAALHRELAAKVFRHVSAYDAAVAAYLEGQAARPALPGRLELSMGRVQTLRYGENPGQAAAFYASEPRSGLSALEQLHGKELSYNNFLDLDGAILSLCPFAYTDQAAVCIVKHTTPCGLAVGETLSEAYVKAQRTDPVSSFGSVIATNRTVDGHTAELMAKLFIECIVAPAFHDEALEILQRKKNLRLLTFPGIPRPIEGEPEEGWWREAGDGVRARARFIAAHGRLPEARTLRSVYGGMLAQTPPEVPFYGLVGADWRTVTREPTAQEWDDLRFAWAAVYGVKSNAILMAGGGATLGIGAGQMSRVDSSRIAVQKAEDAGLDLHGAVLASDAFFPFRDGVDAAADAGVKAIVQPGGSIRDEEVIQAAEEHGIAMVFTGQRLFRH